MTSILVPNSESHQWLSTQGAQPLIPRTTICATLTLSLDLGSWGSYFGSSMKCRALEDPTFSTTPISTVQGNMKIGMCEYTKSHSNIRFHLAYDMRPQGDSRGILPTFYWFWFFFFHINKSCRSTPRRSNPIAQVTSTYKIQWCFTMGWQSVSRGFHYQFLSTTTWEGKLSQVLAIKVTAMNYSTTYHRELKTQIRVPSRLETDRNKFSKGKGNSKIGQVHIFTEAHHWVKFSR